MYNNMVLAYNKSQSRQHHWCAWLLYCWSLLKRLHCVCLTLLALQLIWPSHGALALGVGGDATHANLTELGSPAPKYQTAYACEGKKLTIECEPGDLINLIRANYGRFSITICNDHGNVEWSVNCMFPKSLTVLNSRCANKQSCSVLATTSMFGDPCPGTHKYLEAHYQCISASQTSTTTHRPSPPPWVLNNPPPILPNPIGSNINNTLVHSGILIPPPVVPPQRLPQPGGANVGTGPSIWHALPSSPGPPTLHTTLPGGRLKGNNNTATRHDTAVQSPTQQQHHHHRANSHGAQTSNDANDAKGAGLKTSTPGISAGVTTTPPNTRILTGVGGMGSDDSALLTTKTTHHRGGIAPTSALPTGNGAAATDAAASNGYNVNATSGTYVRTINNININANLVGEDETNLFCGPTNARNLFWNITRVGDVNVQPCPGGAAGIAKWRCVLMKRLSDNYDDDVDVTTTTARPCVNGSNCDGPTMLANKLSNRLRNFEPTWHPLTPDLTQCRSLWLNNLEMRVNQRDSSLISIANDLSEVTSSKTLYGGDMLVTTKIIQTMSEKMFHDKETFPDQRQREGIILELLHGVVKTGSNLLDESQLPSWLDLNQEDQMRVATSLLTGLEYNAFLLADTMTREANEVQKVKNILLSVRVLETKNIQSNVVFPEAEQWQISTDRIELPRASLIENSEGGLVRIVFAAFDRLESILKPTYDYFDLRNARSYVRNTVLLNNDTNSDGSNAEQRIRILNSKVISASLGKGRHIQLSQPIKLVLRHLKTENVTNPTCVFWNYIDHAWSANGCSLESTNRTHSVCMCNHLTNFAILMDVVDEHSHSLFGMFDNNLRILIYVSITICLVFIVIALLTLKIFNGVFTKSARTSIYRSIYICLFVIEVLFLFGIEQTDLSILCGFNTIFLHCAMLSGIAWFCFEAFQSYTTLTTDDLLLEVDQTAKVNCYYLLSYGLSLTIVAISLIIDPNSYTQNDYCVLMEANTVFYATFVAPIMVFFAGAIGYTVLSWLIMCRKTRSALKNKEHTRLANVRFDIRCSLIFLLLFCAVWSSAYFYLRRAKLDDEMSTVYGYMFIGFNSLMGLYIFVFHCIQNEKIRREYRKYVRQNSWLPKCLRCSKTSIASGVVGASGTAATNAGTISSNTNSSGGVVGAVIGTQLKKSKSPVDINADANDNEDTCTATAEDAIIPSSDCELNEPQARRANATSQAAKSGIIPGSIVLQHGGSKADAPGSIIVERNANVANNMPGATGTLRSINGLVAAGARTPSAGHTSPTSSVSSTHLIFGHGHKPQQAAGSISSGGQQEAYYHQPDYYSWKQMPGSGKNVGGVPPPTHLNYYGNSPATQQQQPHEIFYWTQKHNQHGKKKRNGNNMKPVSPSGSLHSRTTASSQQILFYPSYKKTNVKNPQAVQQYPLYTDTTDPHAFYQQQQHQQAAATHRRYQQQQQKYYTQQQQQQQLSSDEEQIESAAHARLLHLNRNRVGGSSTGVGGVIGGMPQIPIPPPPAQQYHHPDFVAPHSRYYRNKHSNCDLNQDYDGSRSESFYNQGSLAGDGPVYEEILSNRNSDVHHYDVDDDLEYNNVDAELVEGYDVASNGGGVGVRSLNAYNNRGRNFVGGSRRRHNGGMDHRSAADIDGDDDESEDCNDIDDDDDEDTHAIPQSDERMRRLMAMQDEDFKRRFQRQQRKNAAALANNDAGNYHEAYDPQQALQQQKSQQQQQQQQQQHATTPKSMTVFGVSGGGVGGEGSIRSFKRSPSGRLAVNELFQHGPPLPPANQQQQAQQLTKRQQQQPQQLSPQSTTSSSSSSQQLHQQQQLLLQQPRNISAMLDENNTVRCYLEPLAKK